MRVALVSACVVWTVSLGIAQQSARSGAIAAPHASADGFETIVMPFLAANCFGCHGNETHKRNLNFEAMTSAAALVDQRERWDDVVQKLRDREMPPADEPQPAEHQRQAVAAWLGAELARIDRTTPPNPGRVAARRLNRAEYNNTVRDLLGVDTRPADDFPQDDSGYGFDNIADVLSLSPALMEKYMTAGEQVARTALFGPPAMTPTLTRLRSDGRRNGDARTFPAAYDVTGLSLPNAFHALHRIPVDAEYVFRVGLGGLRPAGSEPITVALWIDDRQAATIPYDAERAARFDEDRQDFGGQTVQFRVRVPAGDRAIAVAIPRIFEGLPARLGGPNPSTRPEPPRKEFKPPPGAPPERIAQLRKQFDDAQTELEKIPLNGVRVASVDIGGPYAQATGPSAESSAKIYVCGHRAGGHVRACVPRIVSSLAARRRSRTKDRSRKDSPSAFRRSSSRLTSCSGSSAIGPAPVQTSRSRSTSSRRGSRTSSGRACPTPRCGGPRTRARCDRPACSRRRCAACSATRRRARLPSSSAASGSSSARSNR
jgi:mono/diheme cytochrome c family protein